MAAWRPCEQQFIALGANGIEVFVQRLQMGFNKQHKGEPLIASKSSNVVTSGITFAALDLITRPSPLSCHNVCFCVENVFPSPRAQMQPSPS